MSVCAFLVWQASLREQLDPLKALFLQWPLQASSLPLLHSRMSEAVCVCISAPICLANATQKCKSTRGSVRRRAMGYTHIKVQMLGLREWREKLAGKFILKIRGKKRSVT